MSPTLLMIVAALVVAQSLLPRQWGGLPLVIAGLHLGNVEVLPQLTAARLLIIVGLIRAVAQGFVIWPLRTRIDKWFLLFALFAIISTVGHKPDQWFPSPFSARAGLVLNVLGAYTYGRTYLRDSTQFTRYALMLATVIVPLAIGMLIESRTGRNLYFVLGASREEAGVREGRIRASGPFSHPILAGTAGATALPLIYLLWLRRRRTEAVLGLAASSAVVIASSSSGPLAAAGITVAGLWLRTRPWMLRPLLCSAAAIAVLYAVVKTRGPWFLMASIDLAGGSTGWHRAQLIDQSFRFLDEWWLFGSDYTRHWMPTGVRWNPNHCDLTNYFLHLGVTGGIALPLCLLAILSASFASLANRIKQAGGRSCRDFDVIWCAGTAITAHAFSFVSISYFDQMYVLFYLLVGAVPGLVKEHAAVYTDEASDASVGIQGGNVVGSPVNS